MAGRHVSKTTDSIRRFHYDTGRDGRRPAWVCDCSFISREFGCVISYYRCVL
jgi:hypothetical protein